MRVFVCATYTDLTEERKSVIEAITRLQHQHDSMEFFGARTNRPIETCLEEVRASDLLVLVVGHLYGTLVPGTEFSYTETEYNEGYRLGKPCLVYMRDPKAPILLEHVEQDPVKLAKLREFQNRLRERYTVAPFRGPNELALQVAADIPKAVRPHTAPQTLEERVALLRSGANAWNQWRAMNPHVEPDLSASNLGGADLRGANLRSTRLVGTNLNSANLEGADLTGAVLFKTTLREARLRNAVLDQSQMIGLELTQAELDGASFSGTIIADIDLRGTEGLEAARHYGASTIGVDTLARSQGRIPEPFLRGVGVPDALAAYIRSLFAPAIEFYSCFLAYAQADVEFVKRLHADLQANGVRAWFAPEDLQSGRRLHTQIDEAVRVFDRLILVLSEASLNSEWLRYEIAHARARELRDGIQILCPVSLLSFEKLRSWKAFDADTGLDSAREVREYFIADFSNWKDHASYQSALQRFLRDLRATRTDGVEA